MITPAVSMSAQNANRYKKTNFNVNIRIKTKKFFESLHKTLLFSPKISTFLKKHKLIFINVFNSSAITHTSSTRDCIVRHLARVAVKVLPKVAQFVVTE